MDGFIKMCAFSWRACMVLMQETGESVWPLDHKTKMVVMSIRVQQDSIAEYTH